MGFKEIKKYLSESLDETETVFSVLTLAIVILALGLGGRVLHNQGVNKKLLDDIFNNSIPLNISEYDTRQYYTGEDNVPVNSFAPKGDKRTKIIGKRSSIKPKDVGNELSSSIIMQVDPIISVLNFREWLSFLSFSDRSEFLSDLCLGSSTFNREGCYLEMMRFFTSSIANLKYSELSLLLGTQFEEFSRKIAEELSNIHSDSPNLMDCDRVSKIIELSLMSWPDVNSVLSYFPSATFFLGNQKEICSFLDSKMMLQINNTENNTMKKYHSGIFSECKQSCDAKKMIKCASCIYLSITDKFFKSLLPTINDPSMLLNTLNTIPFYN